MSVDEVACIASEFKVWLRGRKQSSDKWVSTCANFLEMAHDFLEFVNAYRLGDAVAIELGYQHHAPRAQQLGQNKYVGIWLGQQEVLFRNNPYSRLQEWRMNRVVRRYDGSTGKRCAAIDEHLKHGNGFFSNFPMPRSLIGFVEQSVYVGFGLMCRAFTDRWYTTAPNTDKACDYQKTVPPTMTPEKKAIYKMFHLLETHIEKGRPSFSAGYVLSIKNKLTIDLERKKLEGEINDSPETSADGILMSLDELYAESIDKEVAVTTEEELECDGEEAASDASIQPEASGKKARSRKKKAEPYAQMGEDITAIGFELLSERNILEVRAELDRRSKLKNTLRQCIVNYLGNEQERSNVSLVPNTQYVGSWQRFVRTNKNNLHLT